MPTTAPRHCGIARALLAVAALLVVSTGCAPGNEVARKLRNACDDGVPKACADYAARLQKGEYVLRDVPRAAVLYDTACVGGVGQACTSLGALLQKRSVAGVKTDSLRATRLLTRGCELQSMEGCSRLGILYQAGAGVPKDPARAASLYTQACDGADMLGCAHLGLVYADSAAPAHDFAKAAALFKRSCDAKVAIGCVGLGRLNAAGTGVPKNDSIAVALFRQSCRSRDAAGNRTDVGCLDLAMTYEAGRGVPQNFIRALGLYSDLCDDGNATACARAATMFDRGMGVYRDTTKAKDYRRKACRAGDQPSCPQPKPAGATA
jgi:TPR repeat protein